MNKAEVKIKICGLFRECDAEALNEAMPDYAGFVFYEKSRRFITFKQAQILRAILSPAISTVGVFVDAPIESIVQLCRSGIISIVQLHGSEDAHNIARLRQCLPDVEIWQAFNIQSPKDIVQAVASSADKVLLDNGGGTGERFDWSLLKTFPRPFILAGGLTPENISEAVRRIHPDAIDISSGVEKNGLKDKQKIKAAVAAVRKSRPTTKC